MGFEMGIDIALINPGDRRQVYQELGKELSAVEPPFLAASLLSYLKGLGFKARLVDSNALNITPEEKRKIHDEVIADLTAEMERSR